MVKIRSTQGVVEIQTAYKVGQQVWGVGVRYRKCPTCGSSGGMGYEKEKLTVGPLVISHIGIATPDVVKDGVSHEVVYLTDPSRSSIDAFGFSTRFMESELFPTPEAAQAAAITINAIMLREDFKP